MGHFRQLTDLRKRAGLSKSKLAGKAGVSRDLISKAEKGEACSDDRLYPLVDALNEHYYNKLGRPLDASKLITVEAGTTSSKDDEKKS